MSYAHITLLRLLLSLGLIAVAIALSRRSRLGLEGDLLWGAVRGAAQLIAIGYVLLLLFNHEHPAWVLLLLAVMLVVAGATAARRVEHGPPRKVLFPRAIAAIGAGTLVAVLPVFAAVVPLHPWYEARYLVPISGMMLSNAMNVVAQVFERIFASARSEADQVEALLALGATPRQALERQVRATLRAALLPTINGLLTVGLVALPGIDDRADRERDSTRAGGPLSDRDPLSAGRGGGGGGHGRRGLRPAAPLHGACTARAASELAKARLMTCTVQKHSRKAALRAAAATRGAGRWRSRAGWPELLLRDRVRRGCASPGSRRRARVRRTRTFRRPRVPTPSRSRG